MRSVLCCMVLLVASVSFAQDRPLVPVPPMRGYDEIWRPACPELLPNAPVVQPQPTPLSSLPPSAPLIPPTAEMWRDGFKEKWEHEFRPLRPYEYDRPRYDYPRYNSERDGWYMNSAGCYQRDCQPYYQQPRQYYYQPLCQPTAQYYYQQPYQYYQSCQPRQYYCYPQQYRSW